MRRYDAGGVGSEDLRIRVWDPRQMKSAGQQAVAQTLAGFTNIPLGLDGAPPTRPPTNQPARPAPCGPRSGGERLGRGLGAQGLRRRRLRGPSRRTLLCFTQAFSMGASRFA
jgi:hypothetical protein